MTKSSSSVKLKIAEIGQDDVFGDMVRVAKKHRPFSKAGQVILVCHENTRVPVVARGAKSNVQDTIFIDAYTRSKLGLKQNTEAQIRFEKAKLWHEFMWAWNATDAMPRIAARLGVISVGLGFVGLLLGLLSFVK